MTDHLNQHYVPQFYFKLFSRGQRYIHMLLKKENRIVLNASIKKQCAQNNFYGSKKTEKILSILEGQHSKTIRKCLEMAWADVSGPLDSREIAKDFSKIWEAVIFQRSRTELQVKKESPAYQAMALEYFKNHLENDKDAKEHKDLIQYIRDGNVQVIESPQHALKRSLSIVSEATQWISDLDFYFLRNHTDYPFIFSDSPVVFYNTYYQNVKRRGVLGAQTPGLQIFYPLDSDTLLMLLDNQIYDGWYKDRLCIDLIEKSDVSQLNALQLHHSYSSVYFASESDGDYVRDLWDVHKTRIIEPRLKFKREEGWLLDGKPIDGILYHTFEPQLNIKIDLSFVECTPIDESEYKPRKRNPKLVDEVAKRLKKRNKK